MSDVPIRKITPEHPADPFTAQNRKTVARLTEIGKVRGARRYLEVGVLKGQTFLNLNFPEMHAVDPTFRFDTGLQERPNRQFYALTSDRFFASPPSPKPYDLVFLDGLHTFEQTFRDLCAAIAATHAGSVIVIDDTVPSDIFSMMRDQAECLRLRREHGLTARAWHGDVFKVIFALHDFFPNLDYRTIVGAGNPQTVVIRRARPDFKPRWNTFEAISRLDYAGFQANADLLKQVTEMAMFDWLLPA